MQGKLKHVTWIAILLLAAAILTSCTENEPINVTPIAVTSDAAPLDLESDAEPATEAEMGETAVSNTGDPTELDVGVQKLELLFSQDTLTVPANTEIRVTFYNQSEALPHNWVLVDGGMDRAAEVNQSAQSQPDFGPAPDNPNVIAQTSMLEPLETETITFTTPDPGEYLYICTYPGHFQGGMIGTLTVVAP